MKLARRHHARMTEPVIVLVDVVFFLLCFFMLVSRLDATAPFEVSPPVAASGRDMPGGGITISVSETGALAVDGRTVSTEEWFADVAEIARSEGTGLIRINAHAGAQVRFVMPIMTALERAQLGDTVIVVTPAAQ
ncbi:ExbD/TolR family protein [Tropicimonas sp. S265A]|uniref:ExbD/TolR family protein n=1 Tax=Tropicimonas sp. S265A TaxID=3415134 RepID=UPI003C7D6176